MSAPRIALVASREPELAAMRFVELVQRGWDAHLVFDHVPPRAIQRLGDIRHRSLDRRVHFSPVHRPAGLARADIPRGVLRQAVRDPRGSLRWMRAGGRPSPNVLRGHDVEAGLIALRPRLIHFDSPASAAPRLRLRELLGSRTVVSVVREDLDEGDAPAEICRRADALHVPEERVWRALLDAGCPHETPRIDVPMPVAHPDFLAGDGGPGPAPDADGTLRVLSVAPLTWVEGFEWALQAVALARDEGVPCRYRILGDGEHGEAVSFARYELGLEEHAAIAAAPRDRQELEAALREADVYLDGAVARGGRGAVAEALAMGVPVVATDRTELAGEQLDGQAAAVVPRREPAAIARELAALHSDAGLRRRAGQAGRQALLAQFNLEDHVGRLERAYREVLER